MPNDVGLSGGACVAVIPGARERTGQQGQDATARGGDARGAQQRGRGEHAAAGTMMRHSSVVCTRSPPARVADATRGCVRTPCRRALRCMPRTNTAARHWCDSCTIAREAIVNFFCTGPNTHCTHLPLWAFDRQCGNRRAPVQKGSGRWRHVLEGQLFPVRSRARKQVAWAPRLPSTEIPPATLTATRYRGL